MSGRGGSAPQPPPIRQNQATGGAENHGREVGHNENALWESTGLFLWNQVMVDAGMKFDDIEWEDMEGGNAVDIMRAFVTSCRNRPPTQRRENKPYDSNTVVKVFQTGLHRLKMKFTEQIRQNPGDYFPEEVIGQCKKALRNDRSRNMMEGDDDSDLFEGIYPLPRKHSAATLLSPIHHFPDPLERDLYYQCDMVYVCTKLFAREEFKALAEIVFTQKGIGRGGEVKFLNYQRMFWCSRFNILFSQWFQRKTLKSNPTGFVAEYEYPVMCPLFLLGCFWACENGLMRNDVGEPKTAKRRKANFVFQHLHDINDASVAGRITTHLCMYLPPTIKMKITGKSLRYGTMSDLAWDPAVMYEESVALGGWTTASNRDYYVWQYLVAIIPAVLSLAGYPDCRVVPYAACLGILFHHNTLDPTERMTTVVFHKFWGSLHY